MKFFPLFLLLLFTFFVSRPVYAIQSVPTFFCVGGNQQPPCITQAPTQSVPTQSPSTSISNPSNAPVSSAPSTITSAPNPCTTTQEVSIKSEKEHKTRNGAIRNLISLLLRFLLLLLQQLLGGVITLPPGGGGSTPGQISPTPGSISPVPSNAPCISPTSAVTTIPSSIPTLFGSSPAPTLPVQPTFVPTSTNCTPNAILVNPCRPWFGAAASGNSNAASDPISQFTYLEGQIGHPMDIFHDYHPAGNLPLNSQELHFAKRANTYIFVNWKPAGKWADAGGGNATVNANIDKAAANIKAIAPTKIFLTIWHEPENDVTPGTSICPNLKGSAGSPAQYRAMWQNVENRFKADGITNVVWVMDYQGYEPFDCLKPEMWPGNNLVDWVAYDTYGTDAKPNWNDSVGRVYKLLQQDQSPTTDFASKPWAVAEYGTCGMTNEQNAYTYYKSAKAALDANAYPNIKMYMIYASTGNNAGSGCLTNFTKAGSTDAQKQTLFNQFANDPIFTKK